MPGRKVKDEIRHDHNHEGVERRGFIEAAALVIVALAGHLRGFLGGVNGPG